MMKNSLNRSASTGLRVLSGLLLMALLSAAASCRSPQPPSQTNAVPKAGAQPSVIRLGGGDQVAINVWRHTDLTRTLTVDPAGNIALPLVGEIKASGLTVTELKTEIAKRLSKYIVDPQIDINVAELRSQRFHVLGEVHNPGTFVLSQALYAWEAIPMAGGLGDDANSKKIMLIRKVDGAGVVTLVNMDKVLKKGAFDESLYIRNGDVIYVPETALSSVEEFMVRMNNILNPIISLEKGIILGPDVGDVLSDSVPDEESTIRVLP